MRVLSNYCSVSAPAGREVQAKGLCGARGKLAGGASALRSTSVLAGNRGYLLFAFMGATTVMGRAVRQPSKSSLRAGRPPALRDEKTLLRQLAFPQIPAEKPIFHQATGRAGNNSDELTRPVKADFRACARVLDIETRGTGISCVRYQTLRPPFRQAPPLLICFGVKGRLGRRSN